MPTTIRKVLFAAAIAVSTVPFMGAVAQAQSFEIGGAGFSVGFGDDDGFEIDTDLYSDDWDDDEADIELEFDVDEDDEDDDEE